MIYEAFPRDFSPAGDFNGVTAGLDRLQQLGVDVLWLMPIHPIGQVKRKGTLGSPYSVRDYYAINPDYGTKDDLKRLVAEAHRRHMRVIIDIVANHTSWDSVIMQTPEFYKHNAAGQIIQMCIRDRAHPEFPSSTGILVSYNVNANDSADLVCANDYKPSFIRVPITGLELTGGRD